MVAAYASHPLTPTLSTPCPLAQYMTADSVTKCPSFIIATRLLVASAGNIRQEEWILKQDICLQYNDYQPMSHMLDNMELLEENDSVSSDRCLKYGSAHWF
jgi:hypothetical protein